VAGDELADDQQRHRDQVGQQANQVDALAAEPAGQAPTEQRRGDGREDLREEHRPVLGVFDRSYCPGSVKIVLAAGKVTSTMPWTSPAA
jgi:hypothetical protein